MYEIGQKVQIKEKFWQIASESLSTVPDMYEYEGVIAEVATYSFGFVVLKNIDSDTLIDFLWDDSWLEPIKETEINITEEDISNIL